MKGKEEDREAAPLACPVCGAVCDIHDVVDFNKSCAVAQGKIDRLCGRPIYYHLCQNCDFCFAPEIYSWDLNRLAEDIYNADYGAFDPEYRAARPRANAERLIARFQGAAARIRHLDFGGGNGLLSRILREHGFDSRSHDLFVDGEADVERLGEFDLVTAYEVFEHVQDPTALMTTLSRLRKANGLILFSTLLSDGAIVRNERLTWWYASPRNGHISLFSRASLDHLSRQFGLTFGSVDNNHHAFWTVPPDWAPPLFE